MDGRTPSAFSLLSPQGRVLLYIAACPDSPVEEIAESLDLTQRAVWSVVPDLRNSEMVRMRRKGRRHFYTINLDAPLRHPTIEGLTLRPIFGQIAAQSSRRRSPLCD